ncbi:MAG: transglutaminase-like domain-containing protein [Gammaproteobacteria bacterium]
MTTTKHKPGPEAVVSPEFTRLLNCDEPLNLAEAALLIARTEYPDLVIEDYLRQLDDIALVIAGRLPTPCTTPQLLGQINEYLFTDLRFEGNLDDFQNPQNSYFNDVLELRLGIPITLSLLYMEIGQRLGLSISGISFPGHFLVSLETDSGLIVLDPFAGGISLDEADLWRRLEHVTAKAQQMNFDLEALLQPATPEAILLRMLRNLKQIYHDRNDKERSLRILNLMLAITPDAVSELEARAELHERLNCFRAASDDFERLSLLAQTPHRSAQFASKGAELRARALRLH